MIDNDNIYSRSLTAAIRARVRRAYEEAELFVNLAGLDRTKVKLLDMLYYFILEAKLEMEKTVVDIMLEDFAEDDIVTINARYKAGDQLRNVWRKISKKDNAVTAEDIYAAIEDIFRISADAESFLAGDIDDDLWPSGYDLDFALTGSQADILGGQKLLFTDDDSYIGTAVKWDSNHYGDIIVTNPYWFDPEMDPEDDDFDDDYGTRYKILPASNGERYILEDGVPVFRIVRQNEGIYHADISSRLLLEDMFFCGTKVAEISCDPDGVVRFFDDTHRMIACLEPVTKDIRQQIIGGTQYKTAFKATMAEAFRYLATLVFAFPFIRFEEQDEDDDFDNTSYYDAFCEYDERAEEVLYDLENLEHFLEDVMD